MVDRMYKKAVWEYAIALRRVREEFRKARIATEWIGPRVEPVLHHAERFERLQRSKRFSREFARLRGAS